MSQRYAKKTFRKVAKNNGFKKRVKTYGRAGIQLYKDVQYLKGLVNSEPKYHVVQSANNFSWNGIIVSLSDIPQGGGVNNREGNSILPRYLNINLVLGATFTADQPVFLRMLVFRYWGESTNVAGAVTPTEILTTIGSQYSPLSHLNDDNVGAKGDRQRRIEILNSQLLSFDLDDMRQTSQTHNFVMNQGDSTKEHIKWNSSATAEPVSGGCYIMFISDNNGITSNCKYILESKLGFYDN